MPQIKLTSKALDDLVGLQNLYRKKTPTAYLLAKNALAFGLQQLSQYPRIGRIHPEFPEYREMIVPFDPVEFVFLYTISSEGCLVLTVTLQSED